MTQNLDIRIRVDMTVKSIHSYKPLLRVDKDTTEHFGPEVWRTVLYPSMLAIETDTDPGFLTGEIVTVLVGKK